MTEILSREDAEVSVEEEEEEVEGGDEIKQTFLNAVLTEAVKLYNAEISKKDFNSTTTELLEEAKHARIKSIGGKRLEDLKTKEKELKTQLEAVKSEINAVKEHISPKK
jgi:hypothetical protein